MNINTDTGNLFIGIDLGISTAKTVGIYKGLPEASSKLLFSCIKSREPKISLKDGISDFLNKNDLTSADVSCIVATGVGSSYIGDSFDGIPIRKIDEFTANATYGKATSSTGKAIVISMGTGTSYVMVDGDNFTHLGGISIGGGTLLGLSRLMLGTGDLDDIISLADKGNADNVNLIMDDITAEPIPGLPPGTTAAAFAKVTNAAISADDVETSSADIAAGIVQLVLEDIMQTAILISRGYAVTKNASEYEFIMIGNLSKLSGIHRIADMLNAMRAPDTPEIVFSTHINREYATALGALYFVISS